MYELLNIKINFYYLLFIFLYNNFKIIIQKYF